MSIEIDHVAGDVGRTVSFRLLTDGAPVAAGTNVVALFTGIYTGVVVPTATLVVGADGTVVTPLPEALAPGRSWLEWAAGGGLTWPTKGTDRPVVNTRSEVTSG